MRIMLCIVYTYTLDLAFPSGSVVQLSIKKNLSANGWIEENSKKAPDYSGIEKKKEQNLRVEIAKE